MYEDKKLWCEYCFCHIDNRNWVKCVKRHKFTIKEKPKEKADMQNNSTNINGANGTTGDPREQVCWDFYVGSLAENRENAYESAIKAGYSKDHSRNITLQGWFKERKGKLKRKGMFDKSERNLDKVLDLEVEENGRINPQLLRIKTDVSLTIVKTLGKDEGYSERSEVTGKDGKDLQPLLVKFIDENDSNTK